jgi:hypothetical protein
VPPGAGQYRFVRVIPVLIFPGARSCVGFVLPAKRQVIPRSRGTGPEPAMPAWAHGTDGVGPALLSPDGAPVWWLLMDGYVYDIRDDLGGSYRRMVMVVPGHVTDGDGGAGIGHARSADMNVFPVADVAALSRAELGNPCGYMYGWLAEGRRILRSGGGLQSLEDGVGPGACLAGGGQVSFDERGNGCAFGEQHPLVRDEVGVF